MRLDQFRDLDSIGQNRFDRHSGCGGDFIERIKIERLVSSNDDRVVFRLNREQCLAINDLLRKLVQQRQIDFGISQVTELDAHLFCDYDKGIVTLNTSTGN